MNQKATELNDDNTPYFEEMKEQFLKEVESLAEQYFDDNVTDEDHHPTFDGLADHIAGETFVFQDYSDWFASEVSSACDTYEDHKYDEMRDHEMEERNEKD